MGNERPLTDKASAHTCAHICTLLAERRVQLFRYCTNRMKAASGASCSPESCARTFEPPRLPQDLLEASAAGLNSIARLDRQTYSSSTPGTQASKHVFFPASRIKINRDSSSGNKVWDHCFPRLAPATGHGIRAHDLRRV